MNKNTTSYHKSLLYGLLLFIASLVISDFASIYASRRVSFPVTDIVLSNVPVMDVDGLIIYGAIFLLVFTVVYLVLHSNKIPFVIKSVSIFIIIRSAFITLTHLGPFTPQVTITSNPIASLGLGNAADLFFSGHTGMPFLGALIFWEDIRLRYLYLMASLVFGVGVLFGHLHYSIDVLAAFFITHTIYYLCKTYFFRQDWTLFHSEGPIDAANDN